MDDKSLNTVSPPSALDRIIEAACSPKGIAVFVLVCTFVKCLMAACFPFTGDEAYLALWGKYPAAGYYDHPPLTGWLAYMLMQLCGSYMLFRLMPILFGLAIAGLVYLILRPYDKTKARLACAFFTVCPFAMIFVFFATDALLMMCCFLSAFFFFKAENSSKYRYYLLSGIFLGAAFLSKYFALILGFSYLVYFLFSTKTFLRLKGFLIIISAAFPFAAQNIYWNYQNGWPNIMHNWYNRLASDDGNVVMNLIILAGLCGYVFTLHGLYFSFKNIRRFVPLFGSSPLKMLFVAAAVPLIVFVAASFGKTVRPHWFFFFLPFAYIVMAVMLEPRQLYIAVKYAAIISVIQAIFVCVIPFMPVSALQKFVKPKTVATVTMYLAPQKVVDALAGYRGDYILATESFSASALLEYTAKEKVIVYGKGSHHGRQDDLWTDFKTFDKKNILIIRRDAPKMERYQNCFESVESCSVNIGDAQFYFVLCRGLSYPRYREQFIKTAFERYYQIPSWLRAANNPFGQKYGF